MNKTLILGHRPLGPWQNMVLMIRVLLCLHRGISMKKQDKIRKVHFVGMVYLVRIDSA